MSAIISELVNLLHQNRLIPFLGAGFSEGCNLPLASELTHQLLQDFQLNHVYESGAQVELSQLCEYLKIVAGGSIDPVLQKIRHLMKDDDVDITQSQPHLLLARLNTPLIYTTNYDRLIEHTLDYLAVPYQTVVSTADIIESTDCGGVQIVKFHGSWEQPETIILTEADYYERLEFVTPIDIKLRADSLGKSLLFIGYSFSDFNIRYLWFKLRRMMYEVDPRDIPDSYILLFEPGHVTSVLLESMGINTIDLSRYEGLDRCEKLASFLQAVQP